MPPRPNLLATCHSTPGPGLGGHCIPIDPFYLSWRAREFESPARFIELAGEINIWMPRYVVQRATEALSSQAKLALSCAKILIFGLAYKKNVADIRESPSLKLIELFEHQGSRVDAHVILTFLLYPRHVIILRWLGEVRCHSMKKPSGVMISFWCLPITMLSTTTSWRNTRACASIPATPSPGPESARRTS